MSGHEEFRYWQFAKKTGTFSKRKYLPKMHSFIINQMFNAYFFSHPKSLFSICKTLLTFCNYIFRLFPEIISSILSDSSKRERVLSLRDASDILRDAFSQTEARVNNSYEVLWSFLSCLTLVSHFGLV